MDWHAASWQAPGEALVIHAGDHVGASPPNSALLQDEPAISFVNLLANDKCLPFRLQRQLPGRVQPLVQARCNVVGTPGNHEFDEGSAELLRLVEGGNHAGGPFLEPEWKGARFPYISANVVTTAGESLLPPYTIKSIDGGIRVGVSCSRFSRSRTTWCR